MKIKYFKLQIYLPGTIGYLIIKETHTQATGCPIPLYRFAYHDKMSSLRKYCMCDLTFELIHVITTWRDQLHPMFSHCSWTILTHRINPEHTFERKVIKTANLISTATPVCVNTTAAQRASENNDSKITVPVFLMSINSQWKYDFVYAV